MLWFTMPLWFTKNEKKQYYSILYTYRFIWTPLYREEIHSRFGGLQAYSLQELLASANTAGCLSKDGQVEARSRCIPGTCFFQGIGLQETAIFDGKIDGFR